MDPDSTQQLIIILIFLGFSAFFSASETAMMSLNKLRLRSMKEEREKDVENIEKIIKKPNKLLSSILVGNNIVNLGASSLATAFTTKILGGRTSAIVVATTIITIAVLIFGEILPKTYSANNSEKAAFLLYRPVSFFIWLFTPIVFVINITTDALFKFLGVDQNAKKPAITESELKTMVSVSREEGLLEIEESRIIHNVFDFGDSRARDVMTPRTDIMAARADATREDIEEIFNRERFSRMPIYKDDMDDIVGVLHLKDFIFDGKDSDEFDLSQYIREAYFTYETKPVLELFHLMRTKSIALAVVLDEYGGTAGIITLEDLIEEIVGDISDEHDDHVSEIVAVSEGEYLVEPSTKLSDVNERLGIKLESKNYESIGGYVIELIDRLPEKHEVIESGGIKFVIEDVEKNRIEKIRMRLS